jgi:hypothetical protein
VTEVHGWHPIGRRAPASAPAAPTSVSDLAAAFVVSPFTRLARTHALCVAGDAMVTVALAGSVFFSVGLDAARSRTTLYLLLTMAPFAVISPLIGPLIDRTKGGRRVMVLATTAGRVVVALAMARHIDSLLLFPEAFLALVFGKAYHVSKSALVPTLVRHSSELVGANSRLVLISGVAGGAAGGVALLLNLVGPELVLIIAAVAFAGATVAAWRIPATQVATTSASYLEREELRSAAILLAASAMAIIRGVVGFLTFLLAFWLKQSGASSVWLGVMVVASMAGNLGGAAIAPLLRRRFREEMLLGGVAGVTAVVGVVVAIAGGYLWASVLAMTVGFAASLGKLSFEAIVQRDAPDANQGRSFARFETRFQIVWVLGALAATVIPVTVMPADLGFLVIGLSSGIASFFYLAGLQALQRGERTPGDRIKSAILTEQRRERLRSTVPGTAYRTVQRLRRRPLPPESPRELPAGSAPELPAASSETAVDPTPVPEDHDDVVPAGSRRTAPASPDGQGRLF